MLPRSHDTTIDLDLELARAAVGREPRLLRPVRARADRARCWRKAGEERVAARARRARRTPASSTPSERELVKKLLAFPDEVAEAAERRAPHRIAAYALELAQVFTAFYRDCQVVGASPRRSRTCGCGCASSRSARSRASLDLLGVSAPEQM